MEKNNNSKIISSNDYVWILNTLLKNWYVFLILTFSFFIFGYIFNHKKKSLYNTKIEILLKSNDVYDYQENLQSSLGFYNYYGDISNQKRIIGSFDMIQKALNKLDLSCSYFIKGRLNTKEFLTNYHLKLMPMFLIHSSMKPLLNLKLLMKINTSYIIY